MQVRVLPVHGRRQRHEGRPATVLELPTESRGRARVAFAAGGTAKVPIARLINR